MTLQQQTGGLLVDICTTDWTALINRLSDAIINRNSGFPLTHTPKLDKAPTVKVNGGVVEPPHYEIDATNRLLKFKESYPLPPGAKVEIVYYY